MYRSVRQAAPAKDGSRLAVKVALDADGSRFLVTFRFQDQIISLLKSLGANFDRKEGGTWSLPCSQYATFHREICKLDVSPVTLELDPLPACITKRMLQPSWGDFSLMHTSMSLEEFMAATDNRIPAALAARMMPYQRSGVALAIKRQGRILWADQMGLGKTLSSLVTVFYYSTEWPLLIVCPSSLKLTWAAEIEKWLGYDDQVVQVIDHGKTELSGLISIVSYDLTTNIKTQLIKRKFKVIICDESHYIKNGKAQRTTTLVPLLQKAKRVLLLTGTPALSRPIELYQQINSIIPTLFPSEVAFGKRYCNSYLSEFGWKHEGSSNESELYCLLTRTIMIRREKTAVLKDLPPKTRHQVFVECPKKFRGEIQTLLSKRKDSEIRTRSAAGAQKVAFENDIRVLTTKLWSLTGQAKLSGCIKYIEDILSKGTKFLVFAHHKDVMDAVMDCLCKHKVRHIRIDGTTPSSLRQQHCDRFQADSDCRVAILSLTAASTGLTLHAATTVIFAELYWNPGQLLQAEDRAHRVGQQNHVDVRYVLCRQTLDDQMWQRLQQKTDIIGKAMTGERAQLDVQTASPGLLNKEGTLEKYFASQKEEPPEDCASTAQADLSQPSSQLPSQCMNDSPHYVRIDVENMPPPKRSKQFSPLQAFKQTKLEVFLSQGTKQSSQTSSANSDDDFMLAINSVCEKVESGQLVDCPLCGELIPQTDAEQHMTTCTSHVDASWLEDN